MMTTRETLTGFAMLIAMVIGLLLLLTAECLHTSELQRRIESLERRVHVLEGPTPVLPEPCQEDLS